jgi:predicted Zn-dependent protease
MTREGYDPNGMVRVLEVLKREAKGAPKSAIFSTHPDPAERVKRAVTYIKKNFPDAGSSNQYVVNAVRFRQVVLDELAKFPPPRHGAAEKK